MGLSILLHGESGTGKSTLSDTAAGPRLVLDIEGGARLQESEFVVWENVKDAPPQVEGNMNVILDVFDFDTVQYALQWLQSGKHPFRSVVIDSLSELQKRLIDKTAPGRNMEQGDWGVALRELEFKVRMFKDLTRNPHNPLDWVVIISGSQFKDDVQRPALQGAIVTNLPYYFDIVGYTTLEISDNALVQRLQIFPLNKIVAKARAVTGKRLLQAYGAVITNPNLVEILQVATNPTKAIA